ncbi:hypothetical protein K1719_025171 [Acacia pycnantha]|nr:hypothetical protein K1719_025171 [Acacia pycnantha]
MALQAKASSPQPTEDDLRSTKKVRIRSDGEEAGSGKSSEETDVVMEERVPKAGISYRDKLTTGDKAVGESQKLPEVMLTEADFQVGKEGEIPCIEFSREIRATLAKGMERSLIVKLLGRSILYHDLLARTQMLWKLKGSYQMVDMEGGFYCTTFALEEDYIKVLTGGPWMVYGAYLTVQPWSLEFDAKTGAISKVVAWIRIPGLSIRYYHKSTLRAIGALFGKCCENRLHDGGTWSRKTSHICFACGKYGHSKERCGVQAQMSDGVRSRCVTSRVHLLPDPPWRGDPNLDAGGKPTVNSSPYGSWMMVKYPKKGNNLYRGKRRLGDLVMKAGSRFNVLYDCEDISPPSALADKKEPMENGTRVPAQGCGQWEDIKFARVKGWGSPSPCQAQAVACGSGVCPEKVPNPVGALSRHDENGMVGVVGPIAQGSGLVPIKTSSSLEESNHTVMILKQSRQALESLTVPTREPMLPQASKMGRMVKEEGVRRIEPAALHMGLIFRRAQNVILK